MASNRRERLVLPLALTVVVVGSVAVAANGCKASTPSHDAAVADSHAAIDAPVDVAIDMAPDTPMG
jgi:hypothetical protein